MGTPRSISRRATSCPVVADREISATASKTYSTPPAVRRGAVTVIPRASWGVTPSLDRDLDNCPDVVGIREIVYHRDVHVLAILVEREVLGAVARRYFDDL